MRPHLEVLSVKSTSGFLSIIQKAAVSAIYKPCSISVVFLSNGYYVFLLASI